MCSADAAKVAPAPTFDELQKALENSSSRNARVLAAFLLFQAYILVIVAGTTDLQLLLPESRITLPILGVELPLFGFYIVAPLLVVIMHFNFLLNLFQHSGKLRAWYLARKDHQAVLLPGFFFNYIVLHQPGTFSNILPRTLLVIIVCIFPLALLLFVQIRFADYHYVWMTAFHCLLVWLDLFILAIYGLRIIYPQLLDKKYDALKNLFGFYWRGPGILRILFQTGRVFIRSLVSSPWIKKVIRILLLPIVFIADIPRAIRGLRPPPAINPLYTPFFAMILLFSLVCLLVVIGVTQDYFTNDYFYIPLLDVAGAQLVKKPPSDVIINAYLTTKKDADSAWIDFAEGINLRRRDLRFANLANTNLFKAQLQHACLNRANLSSANLE